MITSNNLQQRFDELRESFDLSVARPIETEVKIFTEYIAFKLGHETFAWPTSYIKEMLLNQRIIPIPGRMENLYGVVNYKNQVLPVKVRGNPSNMYWPFSGPWSSRSMTIVKITSSS